MPKRKQRPAKYKAGDRVRAGGKPSTIHAVHEGTDDGKHLYTVAHEDGSGGGIERESTLTPADESE